MAVMCMRCGRDVAEAPGCEPGAYMGGAGGLYEAVPFGGTGNRPGVPRLQRRSWRTPPRALHGRALPEVRRPTHGLRLRADMEAGGAALRPHRRAGGGLVPAVPRRWPASEEQGVTLRHLPPPCHAPAVGSPSMSVEKDPLTPEALIAVIVRAARAGDRGATAWVRRHFSREDVRVLLDAPEMPSRGVLAEMVKQHLPSLAREHLEEREGAPPRKK